MYDWLPGLCRELRGNILAIYWILIVPLVLFLTILEYFKIPDQGPDIPKVVRRAVISIILLLSFNEILHIISFVGDGIVDRIGGMGNIQLVLKEMWKVISKTEISWLHYKEMVIFSFSLLAYIAAYLGAFVADALIHFCWAILYIASPLMILAYIPEGTAGTCKNLYRSLCTVMCWKILWAILGALLLKLSTAAPIQDGNDYNAILVVVMNLFIGASMLFVPFATKSLIGDGLGGFASGLAAIPAVATQKTLINVTKNLMKRGAGTTLGAVGRGAQFAGEKTGLRRPRPSRNPDRSGGNMREKSGTGMNAKNTRQDPNTQSKEKHASNHKNRKTDKPVGKA